MTRLRTVAALLALVALGLVPAGSALAADPAATPAVAALLPACTTANDPAPMQEYGQWKSTFIDTRYRVTRSYVPPKLVSTANAGTTGGFKVRKIVIDDLAALVKAARRADVTIRLTDAYRSYAQQKDLWDRYVDRVGAAEAALLVDRPGHSEHQLGTTLDIAKTRGAYAWLADRAWRFGFVISYPKGGDAAACHTPRPGHVRYVGRERAAAIHASGLVPREWLWTYVVAPPSFAVSVNRAAVPENLLTEPTYLAFTFTSTSAKRDRGLARFVVPMQDWPAPRPPGRDGPVSIRPPIQVSQPAAAGYFRVEATTCASADVVGFSPSPANAYSEQSIDMSFDCQPDQSFVLHWFPAPTFFDFSHNGTFSPDAWTFPVATRSAVTDPWTPQTGPTVHVKVSLIQLPPLPYITPPVKLTSVELDDTPPGDPPQWTFSGAGEVTDYKVVSTIQGGEFYRVDTGALVTLEQPENLRLERTLQVVSCIELNGGYAIEDTPPGVLPVSFDCDAVDAMEEAAKLANIPPNTFKNLDGTFLSGQVSVAFKVNFAGNQLSDWSASVVGCRWYGGQFSPGSFGYLWKCSLDEDVDHAQWDRVRLDLRQAQYCPTGDIRDNVIDREAGHLFCLD